MTKSYILLIVLACLFQSTLPAFAKEVNQVELQWVLCEGSAADVLGKLGSSPSAPSARRLYYLETEQKELLSVGVLIRFQSRKDVFRQAIKIKFQDESDIPWETFGSSGGKCEWNSYSGNDFVDCSLSREVENVANHLQESEKNAIETQTGFQGFSNLKVWGPAFVETWKWTDGRMAAEVSLDSTSAPGFHHLELSIRVDLKDKGKVAESMRRTLQKSRIRLCERQEGKSPQLLDALIRSSARAL